VEVDEAVTGDRDEPRSKLVLVLLAAEAAEASLDEEPYV
jgi:hypothetical protein